MFSVRCFDFNIYVKKIFFFLKIFFSDPKNILKFVFSIFII